MRSTHEPNEHLPEWISFPMPWSMICRVDFIHAGMVGRCVRPQDGAWSRISIANWVPIPRTRYPFSLILRSSDAVTTERLVIDSLLIFGRPSSRSAAHTILSTCWDLRWNSCLCPSFMLPLPLDLGFQVKSSWRPLPPSFLSSFFVFLIWPQLFELRTGFSSSLAPRTKMTCQR